MAPGGRVSRPTNTGGDEPGRAGEGGTCALWILTSVLRWACESLVATKYWTGASTMMTAAPIKALIPRM